MADDRPFGRPLDAASARSPGLDAAFSDREVPRPAVAGGDGTPAAFVTPPATALALELLLAGEALPLPRVVAILRGVAAQLDALAAEGKVYGALSPSTVAVDTAGRAYLVPPDEVEELRPGYLAPEQRHGDSPDARLDQYALAIVAYELLTGERREARLADGPLLDVVNEIRLGPEHPLRPGVGPGANEVIRRGMARDPAWRFASAAEFVESLATQLDVPPPVTVADESVLDRVAAARLKRAARSTPGSSGLSPASRFLGLLTYGIVAVGAVFGLAILGLNLTGRSASNLSPGGGARPSLVGRMAGALADSGGGGQAAGAAAAAPAATQGFLSVQTDAGTATILLDGRAAGTAPGTIAVVAGFHTVAVEAAGRSFAPAVVTVRVAAGDTARASFSSR